MTTSARLPESSRPWRTRRTALLLVAVLSLAFAGRHYAPAASYSPRSTIREYWTPLHGDPLAVTPSIDTTYALREGDIFTPVDPRSVLVLQSDTRAFDTSATFDDPIEAEYWVSSVMGNVLWALRHGYDYRRPVVEPWPGWHSTWPRFKVMRDILANEKYDFVIFFDSDAFNIKPQLSLDDLRRRWGMHDRAAFLASHDRWAGQIVAGFWIFRRTAKTIEMLDKLMGCPDEIEGCEHWKRDNYHEQSAFNQFIKPLYTEGEDLIVAPCQEAYGAPNYSPIDDCQGQIIRHTGGPGKGQLPRQVAQSMLQSMWQLMVAHAFNGTHLTLR